MQESFNPGRFMEILFLLYFILSCDIADGLSAGERPPREMKRIAVIGAGISGLAVGHALHSLSGTESGLEIQLFDSRPRLNTEDGAGIQLNGGLVALGKIDKDLQQAVMNAGLPQTKVQSRAKAWKDPSPSNYDTLLQLDLESIVRSSAGKIAEYLIQDDKLLWYAIMRGTLQEVLLKNLPRTIPTQFGKTLVDIESDNAPGSGVLCRFSDNSTAGPFDLVVGCDGIKSAVKEYIEEGKVGNGNTGIYSGIRIRYAVREGDSSDQSPVRESKLTQYFGDGAYALDGLYGAGQGRPPTRCAFTIFLDRNYFGPFKKKEISTSDAVDENVDWTQNVRFEGADGRKVMLKQAESCNLPQLDIASTISNADRLFELGVYYHSPFSLTGWSKQISADGSFAVLAGDAAHAMPPFLGQGANQAIQDAYSLASKICEYNSQLHTPGAGTDFRHIKPLKMLLRDYEHTRWMPTASISIKAAFLGYLETGGPGGTYAKFRDLFFRTMGFIGVAKKVLLDAAAPKF